MKRLKMAAAVSFALMYSAWLGRAEMHTDDTGILVGLIGIGGFVLSLFEPRHPWIWGVSVPSGIILANVWRHSGGVGDLLAIAGFTMAVGCACAYAGALIGRHVSAA